MALTKLEQDFIEFYKKAESEIREKAKEQAESEPKMPGFDSYFVILPPSTKAIEYYENHEWHGGCGSNFVGITKDQIAALFEGMILATTNGEYDTFIKLIDDE